MEFDRLISMHNEALEKRVEENLFLNQRIKARLRESRRAKPLLVSRLRKAVLAYSFLFLVFTLTNLAVINLVKKKGVPAPKPAYQVQVELADLAVDFPGSISQAYLEVTKWQK